MGSANLAQKGCFARQAGKKEAIVTVYVLYCFDARGVVVVQYCFKWGLLYSGGMVQTMHDQIT